MRGGEGGGEGGNAEPTVWWGYGTGVCTAAWQWGWAVLGGGVRGLMQSPLYVGVWHKCIYSWASICGILSGMQAVTGVPGGEFKCAIQHAVGPHTLFVCEGRLGYVPASVLSYTAATSCPPPLHRRVRGDAYYQLLDEFLSAVKRRYGNTTLIHFSDMSYDNGSKLLNMYRTDFPCFSDELQVRHTGTAGA